MPDKDLRLLALDGGGVRGLSTLIILQQLMKTINPINPPKPCEHFDIIGGTSTGGLIAIMLGRLKMTIDESIDAYLSLSDRIFKKKRHRVTIKGHIQGRFDSEELARAVKEVVAAQELHEDGLLKDVSEDACKVFVCATSKETSETVCLTSYKSPRGGGDLLNSVKIWEACRATSAASSFFDPITIGPYEEEFVDGAPGANNPVWEVWNQAQLMWGPAPLEAKIRCLVSIGTGVPSLKPFQDDVLHISNSLIAIATETEQTAERFRRDKSYLDDSGKYYRFNVDRGLEGIGLEESKKRNEIAAATRRYIGSQGVLKQMRACAGNIAGKEYFGEYRIALSLQGVPRVSEFVGRPVEMAELERVLLPKLQSCQQKILVLHGLGGIGKTQLAVEFARQHHRKFSAVFWLDGRSEDILKQSIATSANRIPNGQISEPSRTFSADSNADINRVVREVIGWLAREDNTNWLLIFDNVDGGYNSRNSEPHAYDVRRYFSGAGHGSILITTRQARLEQLGVPLPLGKVDQDQAEAILQSRYKKKYNRAASERLLCLLDGLPLAIAQAAAFLQESGYDLETYIAFYKHQWRDLMDSQDWANAPLLDYPDRSVGTTWTISYNALRESHVATANLLLLWAFLDNKDLWYGLFTEACNKSTTVATSLSEWIGDLSSNEIEFAKAIQRLRNYSLVEDVQDTASYSTHPVVHKWTYNFQSKASRVRLAQLAVMVVGWAVPHISSREYSVIQRRLLPHAQACSQWVLVNETRRSSKIYDRTNTEVGGDEELRVILDATHLLGDLYHNQGKLAEAEKMYQRALIGNEKALGLGHTSTLGTVNNLGLLYARQGKLAEADEMLQRALTGNEKALGLGHTSTLGTVNNLGLLYARQGKLAEADEMFQRALTGTEKALGPEHTSTLDTVNSLGNLYQSQGKLAEAEKMYQRALAGQEMALGPEHMLTLGTVNNLGLLYARQGKLAEAEEKLQRALIGTEKTLGPEHISTLSTVYNFGIIYARQGKLVEAEEMFQQALIGYEKALGIDNTTTYIPALNTIWGLGSLFERQSDSAKARAMYQKALVGYEKVAGPDSSQSRTLRDKLRALDTVTVSNVLRGIKVNVFQGGTSQRDIARTVPK